MENVRILFSTKKSQFYIKKQLKENLIFQNVVKNKKILPNLLILLIAVFYLLNINGGHDWGGDFSMYIMHANNIVKRSEYATTGYLYNENLAVYGPAAYPPIFPLILTPFLFSQGINLEILKIPGILCFITFLYLFNKKMLGKDIPIFYILILLFVIGFFPFFFLLSENILSDFPFLLISLTTLILINNHSSKKFTSYYYHILIGLFIFLAYGTRSIGLVFFPVYFILVIIKTKSLFTENIICGLIVILLIMFQNLLIPQIGNYFDQIPHSLNSLFSTILNSSLYYFSLFFGIFQFENFILQSIFFLILIELFVIGFIHQVKQGISSNEIFFVLYIGVLLVWPSYQFLRFLVPVIPLYFLYIIIGLEKINRYVKNPTLKAVFPLLLVALVSINYINAYISIFPRPISDIEKVETQELFQYVKNNTNSEDVILFFKPRVLALFTERKSVAMVFPDPKGGEFSRMKDFGVSIAILRKEHYMDYQPELDQFIKKHPNNFKLIYNNSDFFVYKVNY